MAWLKCNECACIAGVRALETTSHPHRKLSWWHALAHHASDLSCPRSTVTQGTLTSQWQGRPRGSRSQIQGPERLEEPGRDCIALSLGWVCCHGCRAKGFHIVAFVCWLPSLSSSPFTGA